MKKILGTLLLTTTSLFTNIHAEPVKSDTEHDVIVFTFEGESGKVCDVKGNELDNSINGIMETFKGKKGQESNYHDALKEAIVTSIKGSGCKEVGNFEVLPAHKEINRPVGSIVVAFKDPKAAFEKSKKIVDPLPAVCRVETGKKITLETRRSETMKAYIGLAGDAGLRCMKSKI